MIDQKRTISFEELISDRTISIFDDLDLFHSLEGSLYKVFVTNKNNRYENGFIYSSLYEVPFYSRDVTILDGLSIGSILYQFPYKSEYVLFRIKFSFRMIWILVGLTRRLLFSDVGTKLNKNSVFIVKHESKSIFRKYLVLRNPGTKHEYFLNEAYSDFDLAESFNLVNIHYVMLQGNELTYDDAKETKFLIKSSYKADFFSFANENKGTKKFQIIIEDEPYGNSMLPMFSKNIVDRIFDNAVYIDGIVVTDEITKDLYQSFNLIFNYSMKYYTELTDNKTTVGINEQSAIYQSLRLTYEKLKDSNFLPHLDTQELIAINNPVLKNLINTNTPSLNEFGINVLIFRKKIVSDGKLEKLIKLLLSNGLDILKVLNSSDFNLDKLIALRGGQWNISNSDDIPYGVILVIYKSYIIHENLKYINILKPIKTIKKRIRLNLDGDEKSNIHITDNSFQAEEYLSELIDPVTLSQLRNTYYEYHKYITSLNENSRYGIKNLFFHFSKQIILCKRLLIRKVIELIK